MTIDEAHLSPASMLASAGELVPDGPVEERAESIGVALSGGGVRAALFSLGVLVGLVDSGVNRKVTNISSVSGGSIVNGAIARSSRFAQVTEEQFRALAATIATGLCRRGTFVFSWSALVALALAIGKVFGGIVFVGALAFYGISALVEAMNISSAEVPWAWVIAGGCGLLVLGLFLARGLLQEGLYSSFLANCEPRGKRRRLADFEDSPTTHVIVATELVSGAPVFFSREFVCCPAFGWGLPGTTTTASAVYASAAFPVMFPVRRFKRCRFKFQNGDSPPPFPYLLKLSDGGVYNNLGTDWFEELERQHRFEVWPFGNISLTRPLMPVGTRIVVNAGAASRGLRKVPPFLAVSRTMSVLYDNTVRPRLETMRENAQRNRSKYLVIDISESPYNIARRHAQAKAEAFPETEQDAARGCQARAAKLVEVLGGLGEPYWIEFARQTSSTKTKLTRAGLETGARIMLHGYLSTMVVMHVVHDVPWPAQIKDEGYFLDLAGRHAPGEGSTGSAETGPEPSGGDVISDPAEEGS